MCGRSRQAYAAADIQHHASKTAGVPPTRTWKNQDKFAPTHNAAPGADMAVVALDGDATASLHTMRWGLVPSSTKQDPDHWRMFNARSETVDSLAVFSRLLTHKRCAVPLSGWFEWKPDEFKEVKKKQPYYTTSTSDEPVWAAALYDVCGELETFTLITRDASASLAWLHDRQPVLLGPDDLHAWLYGEAPLAALRQAPAHAEALATSTLKTFPVTKEMNKLGFQEDAAATPIKLESEKQPSVASFFAKKPTAAASAEGKRAADGAAAGADGKKAKR